MHNLDPLIVFRINSNQLDNLPKVFFEVIKHLNMCSVFTLFIVFGSWKSFQLKALGIVFT